MPNPVDDRRRALDGLATRLQTKVVDVVNAAWTSAVTGAAKSVTDEWPDELVASQTKLLQAFAAYRPNVEVEPPVTPRDAAVGTIVDAADQYGKDMASTSSALVDAKTYKSDAEKATIDAARDAMDSAAIALVGWVGDVRRFDASVVAQPRPQPQPQPQPQPTAPQISFATIANGCPYPMTVRATISNPADWASTTKRPDVAFADVTLEAFGQTRVRLDMAADANSAVFAVEVTLQATTPFALKFGVNQKLVTTVQNYVPLATTPKSTTHVVFLVTQPDLLDLAVVVAEGGA